MEKKSRVIVIIGWGVWEKKRPNGTLKNDGRILYVLKNLEYVIQTQQTAFFRTMNFFMYILGIKNAIQLV